jgi:hypothetical protein
MKTQNNKLRKIDFLGLSDSEKAILVQRTKEAPQQRIEEAKSWRNLTETDGIIVNGQTVAF